MVGKNKGFQIAANIILALLTLGCIAPFFLLVISSFTAEAALTANGYSFFPKAWSLDAYRYVFLDSGSMFNAYGVSIFITVVGTAAALLITTLFAYPLSRKDLPGRKFFSFFLFFTMLFSGGLVPSYIMWTRTFHIRNTIFALLIPGLLMSAFNVIMTRTYFSANIPDAVIEAARIDGASEFCILRQIVLPMALPILATLSLLIGLGYWNDWTNGLYYVTDERLFSIQVLLTNIQRNLDALKQAAASGGSVHVSRRPSTAVRMALTVLGILPVMLAYPFLQKYFVKGISVGSVKG